MSPLSRVLVLTSNASVQYWHLLKACCLNSICTSISEELCKHKYNANVLIRCSACVCSLDQSAARKSVSELWMDWKDHLKRSFILVVCPAKLLLICLIFVQCKLKLHFTFYLLYCLGYRIFLTCLETLQKSIENMSPEWILIFMSEYINIPSRGHSHVGRILRITTRSATLCPVVMVPFLYEPTWRTSSICCRDTDPTLCYYFILFYYTDGRIDKLHVDCLWCF